VINCTGYNDVDGAETAEEDAWRMNVGALDGIATRCAEVGATLLQYSTDYVFAGTSKDPYSVDAPLDPVNAYGGTKAEGEAAVRASGCDFLLIRTSWLYAPWGRNFVRSIAALAKERDSIRMVADQRGRPTSVHHLASASRELLRLGARGTLHVCDAGECTWFDFAREIVHQLHLDCRVEPCTTAEFPRPAPRPASSVLDLSRTEALLGPLPHWRENLAAVIQDLKRSTSAIGGGDHA